MSTLIDAGAVIDPETEETPAQLALPVSYPQTAPQQNPIPPRPVASLTGSDRRLDELIKYFREIESRAERARLQPNDILAGWRSSAKRWLLGIVHGAMPPSTRQHQRMPRITIVVPMLDSLERQQPMLIDSLLDQDYPDLEIVAVGNVSSMAFREQAGKSIILLESDRAAGVTGALAKGFARATGEVVAWLDTDSFCLAGILERVGTHFAKKGTDAGLVFNLIEQRNGWRFAAVPVIDRRAAFFLRTAIDATGALTMAVEAHQDTTQIGRALIEWFARRYRFRHEAIHAIACPALGPHSEQESDAERQSVLALPLPKSLWFPADDPASIPETSQVSTVSPARCPVSARLPERLLFSTPDTRFGTAGLHDLWYHRESHCAAVSPAVARTEVRRLAAQQPPLTERRIIEPDPAAASPWRRWQFGAGMMGFALRHPLPGWLLDRAPFSLAISWTDQTGQELQRALRGILPRKSKSGLREVKFLEVACHAGETLDLVHRIGWETFGTEIDVAAAEAARAKGHTIWAGAPDDILQTVPVEARFDIVFLGHVVERQTDPLALIQRAARLLKPQGTLVIATANLDSSQLRLFGPTWAHWHPPFHRFIFSRKSLSQMARASGLTLRRCRSWSHPYWTWLSLRLNETGLAGVVPNGITPDGESRASVETLVLASHLLNDWRGRGDYLFAVMSPTLNGR